MLRWWAAGSVGAWLAVIACGSSYSSSGDTPPPDGGDDASPDAIADAASDTSDDDASDGGPCHGAFGPLAIQIASTPSYFVDGATLTTDEREAYVTLFVPQSTFEGRKVYAMHRVDSQKPFGLDIAVPVGLGTSGPTPGAFDVGLSPDDATLYFSHREDNDAGDLGVAMYKVERSTAGVLTNEVELGPTFNDPTTVQFHPHPAGENLYFTAGPFTMATGVGPTDLYIADLAGATSRAPIAALDDPSHFEANPVPSRDELELFFSSDRDTPGVTHVFHARRNAPALPFAAPVAITFPGQDPVAALVPQHLSADQCRLYVLVDHKDLYVSTRARD